MPTQISSVQPTLGSSEKIHYAQTIVDAFTKAMDSNQCLSKIPITLISQVDLYTENLNDILTSIGEIPVNNTGNNFTFNTPIPASAINDGFVIEVNNPLNDEGDPIFISDLKNKFNQECIPCGTTLPKLDLKNIFSGILDQIKVFIEFLDGLFSNLKPNYCHFLYFLSFLCIPDLARILALIIARIMQLTSNLVLGSISVSGFIMGILGSILSQLTRYALDMVNFAISPITCLLTSLNDILDKLPTTGAINRKLSDEEYFRLYGKVKTTETDRLPLDPYIQKLDETHKSINNLIRGEFEKAGEVIASASNGVQQTFQDLFALKNFMECENERTGNGLFEKINNIAELVQIANLLASLLKKKAKKATVDELCRYKGQTRLTNTTNPISVDDIADIIEEVDNNVVDVIENDNGEDIGIVITNPTGPTPNDQLLSIFTCNLADFIRDNTLDQILEDIVPIAEAELLDPANNLKPPRANNRPRNRVSVGALKNTPGQTIVIFSNNTANNENAFAIINDIFGYNPFQDKTELNYYSVTNPKNNDQKITTPSKNDSFTNLSGNIGSKQFIITNDVVSGNTVSRADQIKCGSIENIKNNLELILGQI